VRRLAFVGMFSMVLTCGQDREVLLPGYPKQLLPGALFVTGLVVDPDGRPLSGVRVDHHENRRKTVVTDSDGRFQLQTKAPALVLRKVGYRSHFIRTLAAKQARIVLEPFPGTPRFCSVESPCESIVGWQAKFCFPKVEGVETSKQGRDIDYGIRYYSIPKTGDDAIEIMHGAGPVWSRGIPLDEDVWESVEYAEVGYAQDILDARGRTADGKRWRYLGRSGESASYHDVDEGLARILDRVLDGVCVRP
jgi:hypothetical protein